MRKTRDTAIRWHKRMEARVAAGIVILVALSLSAVVITAARVATRSAVNHASVDLEEARSAFYRLVDERASFAAQQTRLIIALPVFRAVMINPAVASDLATLTQVADSYRNDLHADFAILSDPSGKPTATPGWPGGELPAALKNAVDGAASGHSRRDIVALNGRLFLVTAEPATFGDAETLGSVTFGFPLDDQVTHELAQITGADVTLISGQAVAGSSLSAAERQDLAAMLKTGKLSEDRGVSAELLRFADRRFIGGTFPLFRDRPAADVGHLVLLNDWAPTQAFLDELRNALLLAGVGGFAIALCGGVLFSRRTSRPLMDMAAAAGDIAAGDWSRQVSARGSVEATTMAAAFNDMTRSLRDQAERLETSARRFSTVTQSARDAIVSTDETGVITFWNRSAETAFAYTESEAVGMPVTALIAEPDRMRYSTALPKAVADDLTFGHTIEVTGLRKDGVAFPAEFSLAALHTAAGTTFTAVIRNVTDRKKSEDTLRQRDEQLRQAQKMEAIGRLAGGVAHDFNNLLVAIQGYAETLVESTDEKDPRHSDANEILKATERAAGLTRQLLAFGRQQIITQQAIALDRVVAGMKNMLERLSGPDIQIATKVWPDLTPVLADATQVEQIVMNLVVNARDAMPDGGRVTIELRNVEFDQVGVAAHPGLKPGDYVEMAISDTGTGMDAGVAARIFEPFFTTKEGGKGTGLGLATVYAIVQQNSGSIEVQSRVGRGTTFHVYLPRAVDLGKPAPLASRSPTAAAETVLLVDDDDRVRALVANMLRKHGYTVLLASAGDQALEIAGRHRGSIQLLLTDVMMPGMNGRMLAERLTAVRPDTRVLYMSGYSDEAIMMHGVRNSAAHFIQKPFSIDSLAHKVREVLSAPANQAVAGSR